jgi:hypothetical protein
MSVTGGEADVDLVDLTNEVRSWGEADVPLAQPEF